MQGRRKLSRRWLGKALGTALGKGNRSLPTGGMPTSRPAYTATVRPTRTRNGRASCTGPRGSGGQGPSRVIHVVCTSSPGNQVSTGPGQLHSSPVGHHRHRQAVLGIKPETRRKLALLIAHLVRALARRRQSSEAYRASLIGMHAVGRATQGLNRRASERGRTATQPRDSSPAEDQSPCGVRSQPTKEPLQQNSRPGTMPRPPSFPRTAASGSSTRLLPQQSPKKLRPGQRRQTRNPARRNLPSARPAWISVPPAGTATA